MIQCTEFITMEWQRLSLMRQITVFVTQAYLNIYTFENDLQQLIGNGISQNNIRKIKKATELLNEFASSVQASN